MTEELLKRHQAVLYEMLEVIDGICRKHGIRYMLFAGTVLGAVRHGDIIPWDDDLDVVMTRPEYDRFMEIAPKELDPEKYFLQKEFSEHWPMFFSKLRKNNTAFLERYIPKDLESHRGVYIDIFPCDNLLPGKLGGRLQFYASKIVIAKSLDRRGYWTKNWGKKIFMALCRLLPQKPICRFVQQKGRDDTEYVHTFLGGATYQRNVYPRKWFDEAVEMPFRNGTFPVSAYFHEMLTVSYGDYMTPTPVGKRKIKVHAELVDLDRSYTEYPDWHLHAEFDSYTRSIR